MKIYKVGDLRRMVKESAKSEFEPKFGNNVPEDNKKNNEKAYKDMQKATADYDGGLTKEKGFQLPENDDNRGMESLFVNNANDAYTSRVKSQLKGFTSKDNEDIHKNEKLGNAEYGSDDIVNQFKKKGDKYADNRKKAVKIGLSGRELNDSDIEKNYQNLYNENHKLKKLTFKNTVFLTENHMLTKVPDSYMVEGNRFVMRDKNANEYLVEWHSDKPEVKRHFTKENIREEFERMMHLSNYDSGKYNKTSTPQERLNETKEVDVMLNKVRKLMK